MNTTNTASTKVTVTKELKVKLIKSILSGEIDMKEYPELRVSLEESVRVDVSQMTEEEKATLLSAARIMDRYRPS